MTVRDRLQVEVGAAHLHNLGPRAICELLLEVAPTGILLERLAAYRTLDLQMLRAAGGDRFPPRIAPVPDDRRCA